MARRISRSLAALARRISRQPCNRPGTDKTFVHTALHQYHLYRQAIGRA
jgi:hypothetical protein